MTPAQVVWLVSSLLCLVAIFAVRSIRLRRLARPSDLSWRGVIGLSILAGALPAIAYTLTVQSRVEIPPQTLERTMVPEGEAKPG